MLESFGRHCQASPSGLCYCIIHFRKPFVHPSRRSMLSVVQCCFRKKATFLQHMFARRLRAADIEASFSFTRVVTCLSLCFDREWENKYKPHTICYHLESPDTPPWSIIIFASRPRGGLSLRSMLKRMSASDFSLLSDCVCLVLPCLVLS